MTNMKTTPHHFVVTRFNLRKGFKVRRDKDKTHPTDLILDPVYLEQRFRLFETYTLPSIRNQTSQSLQWIVLFHTQTPEPFKNRIRELKAQYDFIDLYFGDDEKFNLEEYVAATSNASEWFIMSRIDNDDMFASTYIESVQTFVENNLRRCVVSFPYGEKFDLRTSSRYPHYRRDNHFLSNVFQRERWMHQSNHAEIFETGEEVVMLPSTTPMWTEILHETNVLNDGDSFLRRVITVIANRATLGGLATSYTQPMLVLRRVKRLVKRMLIVPMKGLLFLVRYGMSGIKVISPALWRTLSVRTVRGVYKGSFIDEVWKEIWLLESGDTDTLKVMERCTKRLTELLFVGEFDTYVAEAERTQRPIFLAGSEYYARGKGWHLRIMARPESYIDRPHMHINVASTQVIARGKLSVQQYDLIKNVDVDTIQLRLVSDTVMGVGESFIATEFNRNVHGFKSSGGVAVRIQLNICGYDSTTRAGSKLRGRGYLTIIGEPLDDGTVYATLAVSSGCL